MVDFGIEDSVFWALVHDAERKHIGFGPKNEHVRILGKTRHDPSVPIYIVLVVRNATVMTVYTMPVTVERKLHWTSVSPGYADRAHRSRRRKK